VGVLKNPILIRASLWLEGFLYTHADWILVNSPGFIAHLINRGAKNINLFPNGVDTAMFTPQTDGSRFRQENGLKEKFIVLYAGAHGLSNDLEVILHAARILHNQTNIQFVFVGDGKEKTSLQASAQSQGLDNVIFLPPVTKIEMPEVLSAADVCLAVLKPIDLFMTTYPNKVFDYMAASRPVILAIDGVIRDVVEKAKAGIFVPPGDASEMAQAVLYLFLHPQQAINMGLRGRKYVENEFNRDTISEKYLSFLNEVWVQYERKNTRR
jgi:glycosyltransferase involved in cell wall biosynthesis